MYKSSFRLVDKTLSDASTLGLNGPGSDGNKEVLYIPNSSSIIGTSWSIFLYHIHWYSWLGRSYTSAKVKSVYSTVQGD